MLLRQVLSVGAAFIAGSLNAQTVDVGTVNIDSDGDCNINIGVNQGAIPDKVECIQSFLDAVRDSSELDKINLEEPFQRISFWFNEWGGRPNVTKRASSSEIRAGLLLVRDDKINIDIDVKLNNAFRVRYYVSDFKPDFYDDMRFRNALEFWRDQWPPIIEVEREVFIPNQYEDVRFVHWSQTNYSISEVEQCERYLSNDYLYETDRGIIDQIKQECSPDEIGASLWMTENISPLTASGFDVPSIASTGTIIDNIEKGRLSAEIVFSSIDEDTAFDLENYYNYKDIVFRFSQRGNNASCTAVLIVKLFPRISFDKAAEEATILLREIDGMEYQECALSPF